MPGASFVQTSFLGGAWSPPAQTRTDLPGYKTALKQCTNAYPRINGAWTRRPGFQFMAHTRQGQQGRLIGLEFSYEAPYQIELTAGYLRLFLGQSLLFTNDVVTLSAISTATPAIVTANGGLPSTWNDGDTVVFDFVQPMTAAVLSGRQFEISILSGTTFALYDSLTGAPVNGSALAYTIPQFGVDYIHKVLEFVTPYLPADIDDVRLVKNGTNALLLHPKYQPIGLTSGTDGLTAAAQYFNDGPYFDINKTATTLTPSGTSGSITLTASSGVGINNDLGWWASDVGRMVRFQSSPASYSNTTTYAKDALVLGSDNNIYQSVAGSNFGHDPTTDDGTHWVLSGQTVTWTWLTITAFVTPLQVTATVGGDPLPSTTASKTWQMGLWSNATGWPSCGTWFQGRFWLGSKTFPNRIDASVSNDDFNFSPSAPDGTVGDANAIAAPYTAPDSSELYWMLPIQAGGVTMGTKSGEWLVRASALGDPITPTSIQIHRVSTYGCAKIDPVSAQLTSVFVQRERRKVLDYANYPFGEATGWYAADLTLYSDDKSASGIEELRYQEEPNKLLWARRTDGTLIGSTFQHAPYGRESYNGWHDHPIGGNRTVVSISTGSALNGLNTTLFAVLKNATTGYYECVALTPPFEDNTPAWAATFTDGTASPSASYIMQTANGDPFDGIRIYGLYDIAGQTVTPQIAGYDLGNFTVNVAGYVDVPFTTTFTKAVAESYNNGTCYGTLGVPVMEKSPLTVSNTLAIGVYKGSTSNLSDFGLFHAFLDKVQNILIVNQLDGLRVYDATTFAELRNASFAQLRRPSTDTGFSANGLGVYHPVTGAFYTHIAGGNTSPIVAIDIATLTLSKYAGVVTSELGPSYVSKTTGLLHLVTAFNSMLAISTPQQNRNGLLNACDCSPNLFNNYIVQVGIRSINLDNEIAILDADSLNLVTVDQISDAQAVLCPGQFGTGNFYGLGTPVYGSPSSTAIHLYSFTAPSATPGTIATIAPGGIDSTWTNFSNVAGPLYDLSDNSVLVTFTTTDSVANTKYIVKFSVATGAIIWKTPTPYGLGSVDFNVAQVQNGKFKYMPAENVIATLNTSTGAVTTESFPAVTIPDGPQQYWLEADAIILPTQTAYSTPPYLLGAYAQANPTGWTAWSLITKNWPPPVAGTNTWCLPLVVGNTYTSIGWLLKPDFGYESGARNGPGFGKIRRHHWYGATMVRSQTFQIGTDPAGTLYDVPMLDYTTNQISSSSPTLYSGTVSQTLQDGYSFDNSIYWQVSRPTPLTISAMGGFLETQDK